MINIASEFDKGDLERAISKQSPLLRFHDRLERQFEADASVARCHRFIRINYIGLLIYHCFMLSDYRSIGDVIDLDILVHFLFTTPIVLAVNIVLARHPPVWIREGLETFAALAVAAAIVLVSSASESPDRDMVHFTLAVIVLCMITMQRLRFPYAVAGCAIVQVLYSLGLTTLAYSADRMLVANSVFFAIVLVSLVGGYALEREHRMGYLLRLREHLRISELEVDSLCDALTGLGNRRALDAAFARLSEEQAGTDTAVLLLDVDHFKLFNDANGHQAGDDCLRRIAGLVSGTLRDGEGIAFRFGGEEFLVLIEDATRASAFEIAGRIRSSVESARIRRSPNTAAVVTVSIGVAQGPLGATGAARSLVASADRALYAAKHAGRNRVTLAHDAEVIVPVAMPDRRRAG